MLPVIVAAGLFHYGMHIYLQQNNHIHIIWDPFYIVSFNPSGDK